MKKKFIPKIRITASIEERPDEFYKITCSKDVYEMAMELFDKGTILFKEEAHLICFNRANLAIGAHQISAGGIDGTIMDIRQMFMLALNTAGTTSIVVLHNHPSGNTQPSDRDQKMTDMIAKAGALLNIPLLDHVIFTQDGYFSFADENRIHLEGV